MRLQLWLWCIPVAGAVAAGAGLNAWFWAEAAAEGRQGLKPTTSLPVTRVVLFNSGVGFFSRSGEVDGDARVDLAFPEADINDLLKSMVLEDFGGGRVAAVSYDSREPITRTLSSFAINLNGNPTFASILQQVRGERVEVTMQTTAINQPGKLSGTIVGIEPQRLPSGKDPAVEVPVLNLWCAEGLRAVKLPEVQQLRFVNPVIESEFRRALEVLATNHDSQKKAVSLHFAGDRKRKVQVGYVVEAPIWKTSYRLTLDGANTGKPYLQGWAIVENTTDEDWAGVRMALIGGRPISFKMDLYNPLYVPRPTVEPELFASLRPPTYDRIELARLARRKDDIGATADKEKMVLEGLSAAEREIPPPPPTPPAKDDFSRGTRDQLATRLATGAVASSATGGHLGDFFQYAIDHPVSLARQKSAMLPIVAKEIESTRVSIYNPSVQPKHPLLGLRFKNTSGAHLSQGPITIFEGSSYAGDTRVLDVQPNEERLISYAIDLGTEVETQNGDGTGAITSMKAAKGIITTVTRIREVKKYRMANRGPQDRTVLVEHPNRTNEQFKLVETAKPIEDAKDVYRFQIEVKAGQEQALTVTEERDLATSVVLTNAPDELIKYYLSLNEAPPAIKAKLTEILKLKVSWEGHQRELAQVVADLNRLNLDQERIRKNLATTPKEAEVYQTYLKKLSDQEKEIDALTDQQKRRMAAEVAAKKTYEEYLVALSD